MYQPFGIDYTVNYCDFRSKMINNKPMEMLIDVLKQFSNNTHLCPFTPPEKFVVRNLFLDPNLLPSFLPVGEYRVDLEFKSSKNVRYAFISIFIETRALTLVDLKMG